MKNKILYRNVLTGAALILAIYFLIIGLVKAQAFLAPLVIAGVISLMIYPLCKKMEKATGKTFACLLATLIIFLLSLGFIMVVFYQIQSFVQEWPLIKENITPKIENFKNFVVENTPLTTKDIANQTFEPLKSKNKTNSDKALGFLKKTGAFLGNYFLVFIYVFFILRYRSRFLKFMIRLFPKNHKSEIKKTSAQLTTVVSQYLVGKLLLMGILSIAYSIGLGISGVENFILISIIAALLTLIPYVGNIIGFALAFVFGYLLSGEIEVLIGIVATFSVSQFLESYVLQPYVIGEKVDLHPFLVIIFVVFWGAVWGIAGMILAVPLMAIFTTIMLHIPKLKLLGEFFRKEPMNTEEG